MHRLAIACVAAFAAATPAVADTFCDQLKAIHGAGSETPPIASITGETTMSGFFAVKTTPGKIVPEGFKECVIETAIGAAQKIYKCRGDGNYTMETLKAAYTKAKTGIETCFPGKTAEKSTRPGSDMLTYKVGDDKFALQWFELSSASDQLYLAYYPKPG